MSMNSASRSSGVADGDHAHVIAELLSWDVEHILRTPKEALAFGRTCLEREGLSEDTEVLAHAHLVTGGAYVLMGDLDLGEFHLLRARTLFANLLDNEWGSLTTTLRQSIIWAHRGMIDVAIDQLRLAADRARALGDQRLIIGMLNDLGIHLRLDRQFEAGLACTIEAMELATRLNDTFYLLLTKVNLVGALIDLYDFEAAAGLCRECLDLVRTHPQYEYMGADCYQDMAVCAVEAGQFSDAIAFYETASEYALRFFDSLQLVECRFEEGRARARIGDRDGAVIAFRQALVAWEGITTVPDLPTPVLLARWWIESLTGTWSWDTVEALRDVLGRVDSEPKLTTVSLYEALAESTEKLGDLPNALSYLRTSIGLKEAYWKEVATRQSHLAAKEHQTVEAQRAAAKEREQREVIDRAMQEVVQLNARNEALVIQLREQSEVLEQLARKDALTGLSNRRHFDEQLERELVRAESFKRSFSVALADIDDFKAINDRYSHLVGDEVLKTVGDIMRACGRATDVVARYGGEEFAMILTEADSEEADALAHSIHKAVERYPWDRLGDGLSVTVSIGVVTIVDRTDATSIIAEADKLLYMAKRLGKNRVELPRNMP